MLTLHPQGKKKRSIDRRKYELTRQAIQDRLEQGDGNQDELVRSIVDRLENRFEGSTGWWMGSVKLDLEARKVIERHKAKPRGRCRAVR